MKYASTIIMAAILLVAAGAAIYILTRDKTPASTQNNNQLRESNDQASDFDPESSHRYEYRYLSKWENYNLGLNEQLKGQISRVDKQTGEEQIIIDDIREAYPPLGEQFNRTLALISSPKNSDKLYFANILLETDAPLSDIIEFNGTSQEFAKLKISRYYQTHAPKAAAQNAPVAASAFNPDNPEDTRTLFLLNLHQDRAAVLLKLPNNQSFNYCIDDNCMGGYLGEMHWLDDSRLEVGIYDTTTTETDENGFVKRKLVEKRVINIE